MTRLAKVLGDLVLVESGLGLGVVVGNVIALAGTGHGGGGCEGRGWVSDNDGCDDGFTSIYVNVAVGR